MATLVQELQERLELVELDAECGREIEGEFMRELSEKGYQIVRHTGSPCYMCTIGHLISSLPVTGEHG